MLAFNVFLPIFLFLINEAVHVTTYNAAVDPAEYTLKMKRLEEMKTWGEFVRNKYLPSVRNGTKQFLVVAIHSNGNSGHGDDFNLNIGCTNQSIQSIRTYECKMSAVIFNEDLKKTDTRLETINNANKFQAKAPNSKHQWHGEIILIHGGILKNLVSNFWNDRGPDKEIKRNNCAIYLYSYYIPCAKINNCPYSCSQEIMLYNGREEENCKITVIGYTEIYQRAADSMTDSTQAKEWLKTGTMDIFELQKNGLTQLVSSERMNVLAEKNRKKRQASSAVNTNSEQIIFQDLMYKCLKSTPLPLCCLTNPSDDLHRQKILSFFVNVMVYYCTRNSTGIGSISSHSLPDLKRCFSSWLQDNIGSDCRICSDGSLQSAWYQQYLVAFCIDGTLDWTTTFGRPFNGWDLTIPAWLPWNGSWNNMYLESVRSFQRRENLFCENKMLDIGSMCTKMSTKTIRKQSMKNLLIDKYLWP